MPDERKPPLKHADGCTANGRVWITATEHTYCPCAYGRLKGHGKPLVFESKDEPQTK